MSFNKILLSCIIFYQTLCFRYTSYFACVRELADPIRVVMLTPITSSISFVLSSTTSNIKLITIWSVFDFLKYLNNLKRSIGIFESWEWTDFKRLNNLIEYLNHCAPYLEYEWPKIMSSMIKILNQYEREISKLECSQIKWVKIVTILSTSKTTDVSLN